MKKNISIFLFFFAFNVHAATLKTNYTNVPLASVVPTVSQILGKNFTYNNSSSQVPISLSMPNELDVNTLFNLFSNSLNVAGLKAVQVSPNLYVITDLHQALDSDFSQNDFILSVVDVHHIKPAHVVEALTNAVTLGGFIAPAGDNKIVISDTRKNVSSLRAVISRLDAHREIPHIHKTLLLNNVLPSDVKSTDSVQVQPFDDMSRLVLSGHKNDVDKYSSSILSLDASLNTVYVRFLIVSATSSYIDEFDFSALFSEGNLSLGLTSAAINTAGFSSGLSLLLTLFNERSEVDIITKPYLQLKEGKQASFNVGREIPFIVSTVDKESGETVNNIQRKKIGLNVSVNARVRPDGLIDLDMNQNLSSISEAQLSEASDLITDDQSLQTSLLLKPNLVYAVGGLTDTRKTQTQTFIDPLGLLDHESEKVSEQEITIFIETSLSPFNKGMQHEAN